MTGAIVQGYKCCKHVEGSASNLVLPRAKEGKKQKKLGSSAHKPIFFSKSIRA